MIRVKAVSSRGELNYLSEEAWMSSSKLKLCTLALAI